MLIALESINLDEKRRNYQNFANYEVMIFTLQSHNCEKMKLDKSAS